MMKTKNFILAGLAGGFTDFLLGWIFYGMLFLEYFGGAEPTRMEFISLGCLTFGMLMAYIYVYLANLVTFTSGMKAGAGIGLLMGLVRNFFDASMATEVNWQIIAIDVVISIVMAAIVGGVVAAVNGALSRNRPAMA